MTAEHRPDLQVQAGTVGLQVIGLRKSYSGGW